MESPSWTYGASFNLCWMHKKAQEWLEDAFKKVDKEVRGGEL